MFLSNVDVRSIVKNTLQPVIVARFIRIHPKSWNSHISMRVEFIGCFEGILLGTSWNNSVYLKWSYQQNYYQIRVVIFNISQKNIMIKFTWITGCSTYFRKTFLSRCFTFSFFRSLFCRHLYDVITCAITYSSTWWCHNMNEKSHILCYYVTLLTWQFYSWLLANQKAWIILNK